jgi:hypothetical protein
MTANRNPFWGTAAAAAGVFCVTIMAFLASGLGGKTSPVNEFLNRYGLALVGCEVLFIVGAGSLALAVDRLQTLQRIRDTARPQPRDAERTVYPQPGDAEQIVRPQPGDAMREDS